MVSKAILINQSCSPTAERQPRLAGVPPLLRAILAAQRGGVEEIFIVGGNDPGPLLGRDPRVKLTWHWVPLGKEEEPNELKALLRVKDEITGNFVVLFADSAFDTRAIASLRTARLQGSIVRAAVSNTRGEAASNPSLYLCGPELFAAARQALEGGAERLEALAKLEEGGRPAEPIAVDGNTWPRTTNRAALRSIELDLARLSIKPSDGLYARFNKRVLSRPLITLFLRTPATPNFITGLGLALAIAAALVIAEGGYWWMLLGSLLWFLSALMDHCDGMVARLKFMESDFGTWFESGVDHAAIIAVYVGLAVGLYHETGVTHHLTVGGLLVFGAVMSFITMSHQRRRLSPDNPADYPNRMHRKLEENSGNLFHWFGRKAYFVARRAVLPYYLVLFCLLDLRVLLLGWSALGANMYWIINLYNNRLLRPAPAPPVTEGTD
jgi:phosphatidylglycerophosphate synthase